MKLYHTETQEDFDELLEKLGKEGYRWWSDKVITPDDSDCWEWYKQNTVVFAGEEGVIHGDARYTKNRYPNIPIEKYKAEKLKDSIKLYHVETQEDFDSLMIYLENTGCTWASGKTPTSTARHVWGVHGQETIIRVYNSKISLDELPDCMRESPEIEIKKYKAKKSMDEPSHRPDVITEGRLPDEVNWWYDNAVKTVKTSVINTDSDNINNPAHYTSGGIETLDYIKAKVNDYPSYVAGNILKYVSRYEHKNGLEDLKKAQFYLNDLIKEMEKGV
nr:DUF3310 domain-containing protein [Listeria seeligeri]